jgi:hypothetical protein
VIGQAEFPIYAGSPRQYKFDGQLGVFVCGTTETNTLQLQPIDYRWREEERWGRSYQAWLDVAFVDDAGVVSQLSLKKDSAINLYELFIGLKSVAGKEVALAAVSCQLIASERAVEMDNGTMNRFFVVDLHGCSYVDQSQFEAVRDFAQTGVFEFQLVGEVERPE